MKSYIEKNGIVTPSILKYWVTAVKIAGFMNYKFDNGPHFTSIVNIFVYQVTV